MPAPIFIECEECGAKLKLPDRSKLGKKIRCPKCSAVFLAALDDDEDDIADIEVEQLDDDEDELDEDFDDDVDDDGFADDDEILEDDDEDDDNEEEDEPVRRRGKKGAFASHGAKGGRSKAAVKQAARGHGKKSGSKLGLIIGSVVGVVVLLGGVAGGLFAMGAFSSQKLDPNQVQVNPIPGKGLFSSLLKDQGMMPIPPRSPIPDVAKWLSGDTELIIHVRLADILASPLMTDWLKPFQVVEQGNAFLAETGVLLTDVESVTIGIASLSQMSQQFQQAQMQLMMGGPEAATPPKFPGVVVMRLKKPLSYDSLSKLAYLSASQKMQHTSRDYLEFSAPNSSTKLAAYLATETDLVAGEASQVKRLIESGPTKTPVQNFGFVDWTQQFVYAMAPSDPKTIREAPLIPSGNPQIDQLASTFQENVLGYGVSLTFSGGITAEIAMGTYNKSKTEAVIKALNDALAAVKPQYADSKAMLPPWAAPLTDELMNGLKVGQNGRIAMLTTGVPDSARPQLAQLPTMIMMQLAMMGMTGNGPLMGGGQRPGGLQPKSSGTKSEPFSSPGNTPEEVPLTDENTDFKFSASMPDENIASSVEGLSEGFELHGMLGKTFVFEFGPDGKPKKPDGNQKLNFSVQLSFGGRSEKCVIAAVGPLTAGSGQSSSGGELELKLSERFDNEETKATFQPILNFPDFGSISHAIGSYELELPAKETKPIKAITGRFHYLTGKKLRLIQIKDVRNQAGKAQTDPDLQAAGLEIKLEQRKNPFREAEVAVISVKPGYVLSKIQAIDAQGEWSFDGSAETGAELQEQILWPDMDAQTLKEGIGFQAFLYTDLKEEEASFTFENIELPKPDQE